MPGVLERGVLDCQGARFVGCQFSVAFLALGEPLGLFKSLLGTLRALRATCPVCWSAVCWTVRGPDYARFVGCQFSVAFLALGEPLGLFKSLLGTLSALRATVPFRKAAREKIIINIHKQSPRNFIIQKAVDNMI